VIETGIETSPDSPTWEQFVLRMLAEGRIKAITIRVETVVNA